MGSPSRPPSGQPRSQPELDAELAAQVEAAVYRPLVQRARERITFLQRVAVMAAHEYPQSQIAEELGIKTTEVRAAFDELKGIAGDLER